MTTANDTPEFSRLLVRAQAVRSFFSYRYWFFSPGEFGEPVLR